MKRRATGLGGHPRRARGGGLLQPVTQHVALDVGGRQRGVLTGGERPATSSPAASGAAQIPQPSVSGVEVADLADRVDLAVPTFSNPTQITNPLFPIALQSSDLLVGTVEDKAFRTEVTVLPWTQVIEWEGQQIETVVSQYNAFLDGRIEEIAYDLYAQADDGSVWYLGESVFNFADGSIVDTAGTWHAGIDGPGAMIMPADPQVGDVYRTENIPGLVFEEVVVQSTGETARRAVRPGRGRDRRRGASLRRVDRDEAVRARLRRVLHRGRWRGRGPCDDHPDRHRLRIPAGRADLGGRERLSGGAGRGRRRPGTGRAARG